MSPALTSFFVSRAFKIRAHCSTHAGTYAKLLHLGPFLLGPLLIYAGDDVQALIETMKRYVTFLILFAAWELLLHQLISIRLAHERVEKTAQDDAMRAALVLQKKNKKKKGKQKQAIDPPGEVSVTPRKLSLRQKIALFLNILLIVAALELFRGYFNETLFILLLAIFSCSIVGAFFGRATPLAKQRYLLALSPRLLYYTGVGYLSFLVVGGVLAAPPFVLAAGMAANTLAPGILLHLQRYEPGPSNGSNSARESSYLLRSYALLAVFGPLSAGLLVYCHELHVRYLLLFIALAVAAPMIRKLPRRGSLGISMPQAAPALAVISAITYLGIFILLRIL